ncbi:hypothetical protein Acsp04_60300 [Actinomadura sp. NBRC 104425]|nr:hypothetical protein [Actinomadura sp. NBRC 104425]GLZ15795.1 hypothetical protein Acsp04_60300 [Actinomadura sp. NBRC 104425]
MRGDSPDVAAADDHNIGLVCAVHGGQQHAPPSRALQGVCPCQDGLDTGDPLVHLVAAAGIPLWDAWPALATLPYALGFAD